MIISVIICTHNPNIGYLNRTLLALKNQSKCIKKWELLVVDNASKTPVSELIDISWHPFGKIIREKKVGLTPARIRGINEAKGDLLVFVDDDNCLKENYLAVLVNIMDSMPLLGVIGAGKILPEFEIEPTSEEAEFLKSLALRNESRAHFSNEIKYHKAIPYGAGIGIRRSIAKCYVDSCASYTFAESLDRNGNNLLSGGDIDLALHACRDGYLAAVIPELELIHIIPKARLDHKYLVNIAAGHATSNYILSQLWKFEEYTEHPFMKWCRYLKNRIISKGLARKILIAEFNAEREARRKWKAHLKVVV